MWMKQINLKVFFHVFKSSWNYSLKVNDIALGAQNQFQKLDNPFECNLMYATTLYNKFKHNGALIMVSW